MCWICASPHLRFRCSKMGPWGIQLWDLSQAHCKRMQTLIFLQEYCLSLEWIYPRISPWNIQNDISISHIISQYITYDIPCDMPCATWLGVIVLCLSKRHELGMPPIFRHSQNNTSLVSCISIILNITIIYGWFYISKIVVGELYPHSIQGYHKTAGLHLVITL